MLRRVERFISVEEALNLLLEHVDFLGAEEINTSKALGRVLAEDVYAEGDYPPFDMSHMDGFALNHRDTLEASPSNPVKLKVADSIAAGVKPRTKLEPGTAWRILTGAYLPEGADCVVPQEEVEMVDDGYIIVRRPVKQGENIDPTAGDVRSGELVLEKGHVLRPSDVAFLHYIKRWHVKVARKPKVALLVVGDELTDNPEDVEKRGRVFNTHRLLIEPLTRQLGCEVEYLGIAGDDPSVVANKLENSITRFDAILTIGGSSVSERDATYLGLSKLDVEVFVQGLKLQPGRVGGFAITKGKPIIFLPGLVISTINVFTFLAYPMLRKMLGREPKTYETRVKATLREDVRFSKWIEFKKVIWVSLRENNGEYDCYPNLGESSRMKILTKSNGYILAGEHVTKLSKGDKVLVNMI